MAMSLEQTDHFLRHVKMHADEVKLGTFKKDKEDYLKKLKEAQKVALEMSHDMIYILRLRKFKGYENADFSFNIKLPDDWKNHEFRTKKPKKSFDYIIVYVPTPLKELKYILKVKQPISSPNKIKIDGYGNKEFNNTKKEKYNIKCIKFSNGYRYKILCHITIAIYSNIFL